MNLKHKLNTLLQKRIIRYIVVGGACFVFEYGVFLAIFYVLHTSTGIAQAISYVCALVVNFLLLRLWAFQASKNDSTTKQIAQYALLVCINLPASSFFAEWLSSLGLAAFIAKVIVVGVVAVWNYIIYGKLIFRPDNDILEEV